MKSARVQDFHTILIGLLTQYDQRTSAAELKRSGRENIYRLGHLLKAAEGAEDSAKRLGIWSLDSAAALGDYRVILREHFIFENGRFALSPLNQLDKKILAWADQGKLPHYGKLRENPSADPWMVGLVTSAAVAGAFWLFTRDKTAAAASSPKCKPGDQVKAFVSEKGLTWYSVATAPPWQAPTSTKWTKASRLYSELDCSFYEWTGSAWAKDVPLTTELSNKPAVVAGISGGPFVGLTVPR